MNRIICLIGPSGCGKTTIGEILKKNGIPEIVSHTTRQPRIGEIDGITYHFVDMDVFNNLSKVEEVSYAGNKYCTSKEEIESKMEKADTLFCIVTKEGYTALKKAYGSMVYSIFIKTDIDTCVQRMKDRGDSSENIDKRISNFEKLNEFNNATMCDYVLENKSDIRTLELNTLSLIDKIKKRGQ